MPLPVQPPIIFDSDGSSAVVVSSSPAQVPERSPSPVITELPPVSEGSDSGPDSYTVQRSDTLYSIAFEFDLDYRQLAMANDLNPPYTIFVGQELNLDMSRVVSSKRSSPDIGTPVSDSAIARSSAGVTRGGVIRESIEEVQRAPTWKWPLRGNILRDFSAEGSEGLDIGARVGDPVLAASSGDVVYAGRGVQGVGNLIIIRHNDRYLSAYGHNNSLLVSEGNRVEVGQQIAEAGQNRAGVPMLHFEIRRDGAAVNPSDYLPTR